MNGVSIRASWDGGRDLSTLSSLILARKDALGGTMSSAVKATAINVLRSIRAQQPVAKANAQIIPERWSISIKPSGYIAGWAFPGKSDQFGRRVVRTAKGAHARDNVGVRNKRVMVICGSYAMSKNPQCYDLRIYHDSKDKPVFQRYVIARDEAQVREWAEARVKGRIKRYRGISKLLLGNLMHRVNTSSTGVRLTEMMSAAKYLAERKGIVRTTGAENSSSGTFSMMIVDDLLKAEESLRGGKSALELAVKRAANATAAIINRVGGKDFASTRVDVPFPEISKKKVA